MTTCGQPECQRLPHARSLCKMHYNRRLRRGELATNPRKLRTPSEVAELVAEYQGLVEGGLTRNGASAVVGVSYQTMTVYLKNRELFTPALPRPNHADLLHDYWELRDQGETMASAADRLGVHQRTIERALANSRRIDSGSVDC